MKLIFLKAKRNFPRIARHVGVVTVVREAGARAFAGARSFVLRFFRSGRDFTLKQLTLLEATTTMTTTIQQCSAARRGKKDSLTSTTQGPHVNGGTVNCHSVFRFGHKEILRFTKLQMLFDCCGSVRTNNILASHFGILFCRSSFCRMQKLKILFLHFCRNTHFLQKKSSFGRNSAVSAEIGSFGRIILACQHRVSAETSYFFSFLAETSPFC